MTWYYNIADDGSSMDIYDDDGNLVTTISNDGSGFAIPGAVLDAMKSEYDTALANADITRAVEIAGEAAFEQIEEGAP